jgi:hypothetical protein
MKGWSWVTPGRSALCALLTAVLALALLSAQSMGTGCVLATVLQMLSQLNGISKQGHN